MSMLEALAVSYDNVSRLLIAYVLAWLSYLPSIHHFRKMRRKNGRLSVPPEARLWWLLFCGHLD